MSYDNSLQNEENIEPKFRKDFKNYIKISDLAIPSEDYNTKNFGCLGELIKVQYKINNKVYFLKVIKEEEIKKDFNDINYKDYKEVLNTIYKTTGNDAQGNDNSEILIDLQTHWEEDKKLILIFKGVKMYMILGECIKKCYKNLTEDIIIKIYKQILDSVNFLHQNKIYGCDLSINSFIYDIKEENIKLTDLGFTKIFSSSIKNNNNNLVNEIGFDDYIPPEFLSKMNDVTNANEIEIEKKGVCSEYYDIWRLGILFYKIATCCQSPFNETDTEKVKADIIKGNIDYSKLNKFSCKITQILDKMLVIKPESRYTISKLLLLEPFANLGKRKIIINLGVTELVYNSDVITMNMVNEEKKKMNNKGYGNADKIDMDLNKKYQNNIKENNNDENGRYLSRENMLSNIKVEGTQIDDKRMAYLEIYPAGSVLRTKFSNKVHKMDKTLVDELSEKMTRLDKEYIKLEENKRALTKITDYVNDKVKQIKKLDNDNFESFLKRLNDISIKSHQEQAYSIEEILRKKVEMSEEDFKTIINTLIFEIQLLALELDGEKKKNVNLEKKISQQEKKISDLKAAHQDEIEFLENKVQLLEDIIFSSPEKKSNKEETKNKNQLLYTAFSNSIKDFTDVNVKLKECLEENLIKFSESKKSWLEDMIKATKSFREEMKYYSSKSFEELKKSRSEIQYYARPESKENKEKTEDYLKNRVKDLQVIINSQKKIIGENTKIIKDLQSRLKNYEPKE